MKVITIVMALVIFGFVYLPIYLPLVISFTLRAEQWREVRWSLRAASLLSFFLTLAAPRARQDFGNDVGGNIAGAMHNFPRYLAWVWGAGIICTTLGLVIGFYLRSKRGKPAELKSDESASV